MNLQLYLAFCVTIAILIAVPGPIVSMIVANALSEGAGAGVTTAVGAGIGNAILLGAAAAGIGVSVARLSALFAVVRWTGAVYLIWLGVRIWRSHRGRSIELWVQARRRSRTLFLQGFWVALTNPKAIVFYLAFLPQFIDPHRPVGPQLLVLSATMILLGLCSDVLYALLAGRARTWLATPARRRLHDRITGSVLIGVGVAILLAPRGG